VDLFCPRCRPKITASSSQLKPVHTMITVIDRHCGTIDHRHTIVIHHPSSVLLITTPSYHCPRCHCQCYFRSSSPSSTTWLPSSLPFVSCRCHRAIPVMNNVSVVIVALCQLSSPTCQEGHHHCHSSSCHQVIVMVVFYLSSCVACSSSLTLLAVASATSGCGYCNLSSLLFSFTLVHDLLDLSNSLSKQQHNVLSAYIGQLFGGEEYEYKGVN